MSSYVPFSEEDAAIWRSHILTLLRVFCENRDIVLLGLLLQQIYEYSVWVTHTSTKPLNLKDLYVISADSRFIVMCNNLCKIRNIVTHQTFVLTRYKSLIIDVMSSQEFKDLLSFVFKSDTQAFDELLSTYSRWLY